MPKEDLALIPQQIENGVMEQKDAVNFIGKFISENFPVFGLQKYNEDFREDIILDFLEKGKNMFSSYDKQRGDFFTYLFYFIESLVHNRTKAEAKSKVKIDLALEEGSNITDEKEYQYKNINYKYFDYPKVPYAYNPEIKQEELRKIFQNIKGDKKLLVVAIKSAYYITDNQIEKICKYYKIDENDFYKTIQYCRVKLLDKADRKIQMQERRNSAYYHHKKYENQIQRLEDSDHIKNKDELKNKFTACEKKYHKNWESLNKKLENGLLSLRPTNKTIASILGICERQVAYYINCAKKNYEDKEAAGDEFNEILKN